MFISLFEKLNHLPVNNIADTISASYHDYNIPIITSDVSSGKTMLIPAACSKLLDNDEIIYVLEPKRLLVNNAVRSLRSILGDEADLIGALHSIRSGDRNIMNDETRIVFCTVGYALSSGIVNTAKNFIIDEAHETSIDLSLTKAILKRRLGEESVRIAIMSATIDTTDELDFWGSKAQIHTTTGTSFPVEYHEESHLGEDPSSKISKIAFDYYEKDRKGVLIFVEGKEQIADCYDTIVGYFMSKSLIDGQDYELFTINGMSNQDEQQLATAPPNENVKMKILIGTNVLESGINLDWVDAGISNGSTNQSVVKDNIHRLVTIDLPKWRIKQQIGRVGRFRPGIFTLVSNHSFDSRKESEDPEITRLPLTELVMNCAKLGLDNPLHLEFPRRESPDRDSIHEAVDRLFTFGLINVNYNEEHQAISLTEDGQMIQNIPLSYNCCAAFCEAVHLEVLPTMIPLLAGLEVGDIRMDFRLKLYHAKGRTSDILTRLYVLIDILQFDAENTWAETKKYCYENNVNTAMFLEYKRIISTLEKTLNVYSNFIPYLSNDSEIVKSLERYCRKIIFRYQIDSVVDLTRHTLTDFQRITEMTMVSGKVSNTSVCQDVNPIECGIATGRVRNIHNKRTGRMFSVLDNVTIYDENEVVELFERHGRKAFVNITQCRIIKTLEIIGKVENNNKGKTGLSKIKKVSSFTSDEVLEEDKLQVPNGTFGLLLQQAFDKKSA